MAKKYAKIMRRGPFRAACAAWGLWRGAALGRAAGPLLAQAACQAAAKVLAFYGFWITFARQFKKTS